MRTEIGETDLSVLLKRHADLEAVYGDGDGGSFLSGWQCENPWISEIMLLVQDMRAEMAAEKYLYLDDDNTIRDGIHRFHMLTDGAAPQALFCGAGSSPLIFTLCAWLKHRSVVEIFYIPPLYFTFHFALKLFGIRARAVSGRHAFEENFSMRLPSEQRVLLLTDPIWYAGLSVDENIFKELSAWQNKTGSLVFVDGSFQYSKWDGSRCEHSAKLNPELTLRLICPTKALAAHGYRFAYTIIPLPLRQEFASLYSNVYGSASVEDVAFGRAAAGAVSKGTIPSRLMRLAAKRHREFRKTGKLFAPWQPSCGYFVFERPVSNKPNLGPLMDGTYFEQNRYPDYRRINLLSPSINLLN